MTRSALSIAATAVLAGLPACASPAARAPGVADPASSAAVAASLRPIPYPVEEPRAFADAVARGTRTRTGEPGPRYWQQRAEYRLEAELEPVTRTIRGRAAIRYHNRSPVALTRVAVHLHQNLYAPGALRNRVVPLTGGATVSRVHAAGRALAPVPASDTTTVGYALDGTVAWLRLPTPLAPGGSVQLEIDWSFIVPPLGSPRMGHDEETFFIAYWYPQMAVYDDISGWHTDPYLGNAEFYMGYGDYDVALTVPAGWLVAATGVLQNPAEVLSARTRARLDSARRTRDIVRVVRADERGAGQATAAGQDGRLTWRFQAGNVRDFAFAVSDRYLWDATAAVGTDGAGDGSPDTVLAHAFYRPERVEWAWDEAARYTQHSVEFLSRYLWPYPYPHMTAVDGLASCGGMEFPMITCIGGRRDTLSLYSVTVHEIAHMWFPMLVGSDEKRHSWQDEGLTRFNQAQAMRDFFDGYDLETIARDRYLDFARTGGEVALMRHGDRYPLQTRAFGVASYDKKATITAMLRAIIGEETFLRAYRGYGRRWTNRHPQPHDFFNTVERIAGRDLSWFWRGWYYETWTLDHAITGVTQHADAVEIVIEDRGDAPMPVRLAVTRADGRVERHEVPVDVWLGGVRRHVLRVPGAGAVVRVEIDPEGAFAYLDRSSLRWERRAGG